MDQEREDYDDQPGRPVFAFDPSVLGLVVTALGAIVLLVYAVVAAFSP